MVGVKEAKVLVWAEIQASLILNSNFSAERKVGAIVEALSQAYENGMRDGELRVLRERAGPFFPYAMPPPPPAPEPEVRSTRSRKRS